MGIKKIEQDLNNFYSALQRGEEMLASFSDEFDSRLGAVKNELRLLGDEIPKALKESSKGTPAARLLNDVINIWAESLKDCAESAEKDINGRQFMHNFEKHPLVVVFGVVKAGKSTLGNFIHGREFRNASFDNPYKSKIPKSKIVIERKGRDDRDKEQFDEDSIESTCSIQYFQIPGLAWVDTPGIAAKPKNDEVPLEQLANDYVPYADIVVFLATSDHVETRETIDGFCKIYNAGKKMVVAITGSDIYEETDDGDDLLVPKDIETRNLQQESFLKAIKKELEERHIKVTENIEAISISTLLAKQAIDSQSDPDWDASHMGLFYRKIADIIGNEEIINLKKREPKAQMNRSINAILGSENQKGSLKALIKDMEAVQEKIEYKYGELNPDGKLVSYIVDDVTAGLSSRIRTHVESATKKKTNPRAVQKETGNQNKEPADHHAAFAMGLASIFGEARETGNRNKRRNAAAKKDPVEVSLDDLQETIQKTVTETMEKHIARQIGDFERVQYDILSTTDLKTTIHQKTRSVMVTRRGRIPVRRREETTWLEDGLSLVTFGLYEPEPRYNYEKEEWCKTKPKDVYLGPDTASAKAELEKAMYMRVEEYVKAELATLREQFFGQALSTMKELIQKLKTLKANLEKYRY